MKDGDVLAWWQQFSAHPEAEVLAVCFQPLSVTVVQRSNNTFISCADVGRENVLHSGEFNAR